MPRCNRTGLHHHFLHEELRSLPTGSSLELDVENCEMATRMAGLLAVLATSVLMGDAFAQRPDTGSRPGGGPPWMRARIMFQLFDSDRDAALTAEEAPAAAWTFLSAADADKDGKVTQAEVASYSAAQLVKNFDANEDGELTVDEVPEPIWARIVVADADGSESINAAEIAKVTLSTPRRGGPPADGDLRFGPPAGKK